MNEAAVHELLSGRRHGWGAGLLRGVLSLASCGYSSVMRLRNLAYARRWLTVHRATVPVISIGNITTGGTGKTPVAAWLTNWLRTEGRRPGLLSRGYRALDHSTPEDDPAERIVEVANDEKLVLDRLCPGVPHLQQRDRVASAARAVKEFFCDILLLDDGFQHRRLHRDLDLVLIDALQPWGYGHVLPRGLLREPLSGIKRADLIIVTRADQCNDQQRNELRTILQRLRGDSGCVELAFTPKRLVDTGWKSHSLSSIAGRRAFAFCGIGNPDGFRRTVGSLNVICQTIDAFPDHHHYTSENLARLSERARQASAEYVLTTQKDLVKISPTDWTGPPLLAVEIGVEFLSGFQLLESQLLRLISLADSSKR